MRILNVKPCEYQLFIKIIYFAELDYTTMSECEKPLITMNAVTLTSKIIKKNPQGKNETLSRKRTHKRFAQKSYVEEIA